MPELPCPYKIVTLRFGRHEIRIAQPENPDKLFDELLLKEKDHEDLNDERIPYWGELWPSAFALTEFIFENKNLFIGKSVIEIGCGLGLPGIAASLSGGNVMLTDYDQSSVDFATFNWQLNLTSKAQVKKLDWRNPGSILPFDVLLASDVAYESRSFKPVIEAMNALTVKDGVIIIGEPNRSFAKAFIDELVSGNFNIDIHEKKVVRDNINYRISIYVIRRKSI